MAGIEIPKVWERKGLVLPRIKTEKGSSVAGDPCIVWDEGISNWRMVLFFSPPGHAHAICTSKNSVGPRCWKFIGPLEFSNPQSLLGGRTHKPYIVMDAYHSNQAARINGQYRLVTVSYKEGHKIIQRARAERLAGPWVLDPDPLIDLGKPEAFDAKHTDAVTGYHFPDRKEVLYFYMGYPQEPQDRKVSPLGSAQAVAVEPEAGGNANKQGTILPPCQVKGHWASGWVGGLQLLPGRSHKWIAIINASPTTPDPDDKTRSREEPPPSLGGFAYCDEDWPVTGWHWCPEPIEWIEDIPEDALANGEGTNLWRQHILVLPSGRMALFYNSGSYGREQLYLKESD